MTRATLATLLLSLTVLACNKPEAPSAVPAEAAPAATAKAKPAQPLQAKADEAPKVDEAADKDASAPAADPKDPKAAAVDIQEVSIESVENQMAYNKKEIRVKAGGTVRITLINKATSEAMKHNIVIVKKGTSMKVGQAAINTMGVPPKTGDVLAASEIAGPGQTVTVRFTTPPPGEYEFVCTFPGHFAMMKGAFIVE